MLDALLDRSILFHFDRTGYARHAARFAEAPERDLTGRQVIVTGGTAGIGRACAEALASRGATVEAWARDPDKGEATVAALDALGGVGRFVPVDLSDLDAVHRAAEAVVEPVDSVVLNAGSMPWERHHTAQGHELIWASQVLGHLLLLRVLRRRGLLVDGARCVWVSSGGMYTQRLSLSDLAREQGYQRHTVYANAKRAQVMLQRHLAVAWPDTVQAAMHPGWVATEAVKGSMPVFHALTRPILRDPPQGADTIVWLVVAEEPVPSGRFWFDRCEAPEHLLARTRPGDSKLPELVESVFEATHPWVRG